MLKPLPVGCQRFREAQTSSIKEVKNLAKYHVGVDVGKNRHHISIRNLPLDIYHKPLSIPDPILDNLKELTRFRADLVKERALILNQLRETLTILFPEFSRVFRQLDSASSLTLLIAFPGPEHVIHAGEEKVAQCLSNASPHRMGRGMAKRILEAARNTVGVLQKEPSLGIKISILGEGLLNLQSAIDGSRVK